MELVLPPDLDRWAFGLMLVLARVVGAIMLLPGLGEVAPPSMVRAGLALCVTLLLLPILLPDLPPAPEAGLQCGLMLAAEIATGPTSRHRKAAASQRKGKLRVGSLECRRARAFRHARA